MTFDWNFDFSSRKHTELAEAKPYDWDMEEEEKLQNEVELLLLRTAKILEVGVKYFCAF